MWEVGAEGCGSPGSTLEETVLERRVSQENVGEMSLPWSRPRNTGQGIGVGQPKGKICQRLENSVKFDQPQIRLVRVHFESHCWSILNDIK